MRPKVCRPHDMVALLNPTVGGRRACWFLSSKTSPRRNNTMRILNKLSVVWTVIFTFPNFAEKNLSVWSLGPLSLWELFKCKHDRVSSFLKNSQAFHFLSYKTLTCSMPGNPWLQPLFPACALLVTPIFFVSVSLNTCHFLKVDLWMCCSHCLDIFHPIHSHWTISVSSLLCSQRLPPYALCAVSASPWPLCAVFPPPPTQSVFYVCHGEPGRTTSTHIYASMYIWLMGFGEWVAVKKW